MHGQGEGHVEGDGVELQTAAFAEADELHHHHQQQQARLHKGNAPQHFDGEQEREHAASLRSLLTSPFRSNSQPSENTITREESSDKCVANFAGMFMHP
jgi:hypothetical protein